MASSIITNESSPLKWRRHTHCLNYSLLEFKDLGSHAVITVVNASMDILSSISYSEDKDTLTIRNYGSPLQATLSNGSITISIANDKLWGMTDATIVSDSDIWGGVNTSLPSANSPGGLHDKHHTKTDKRIEDIYSTIHDACKHTGQAIQLINSEWMEILSNNTMFISDVGRISVSNRHKFVNGLSYSHRGCINTRQRFSRSLYGLQVTTLSREEVVA